MVSECLSGYHLSSELNLNSAEARVKYELLPLRLPDTVQYHETSCRIGVDHMLMFAQLSYSPS